jgi:hypothetical protein
MSTPWGAVQHSQQLIRGVSIVDTCGHGGMRISLGFAEQNLSSEAIKRGIRMGSYLYYEEDCAYAIPAYELHDKIYKEDRKQRLLESLSRWNADYLLERGITPDPESYKYYLKNALQDKMRYEKNPDLIVSAVRSDIPGITKIWTADGKEHYVKSESYKYPNVEINLLSNCEIVNHQD